MASRSLAPEDALDLYFALEDAGEVVEELEDSDDLLCSSEESDLDRQLLGASSGASESDQDGSEDGGELENDGEVEENGELEDGGSDGDEQNVFDFSHSDDSQDREESSSQGLGRHSCRRGSGGLTRSASRDVQGTGRRVGRGRARGARSSHRTCGRGVRRGGAGVRRGRGGSGRRNRDGAVLAAPPKSWKDIDDPPHAGHSPFVPNRPAGAQFPVGFQPKRAADFFMLFFTAEVIASIAAFTNKYAWMHVLENSSYACADGSWQETTPEEIVKVIAFIIFTGLVRLPRLDRYWSVSSLYHGNWARALIPSRARLQALYSFLHVVDSAEENAQDKLRKVRYVVDAMKQACLAYYQPHQQVSIDERMVKSKARFGFKQYIKNKPVRFGVKIFALCDSKTSYCYRFEVYTGRDNASQPDTGLTHNVVMRLIAGLEHQGYEVYTDNFYTSPGLLKSLTDLGIDLTGTCQVKRRGVPAAMQNVKLFLKKAERGAMRYMRVGNQLFIQWKDKRVVTVLSSRHRATDSIEVQRKKKVGSEVVQLQLRKPVAVKDYNKYMGGVDVFDQHVAAFRVLRRVKKYWKSIFLDLIDMAVVNSYILCVSWCKSHPESAIASKLGRTLGHLEYREQLVRELGSLEEAAPIPQARKRRVGEDQQTVDCPQHMPGMVTTNKRRRCYWCWKVEQRETRSRVYCMTCKNRQGQPLFLCLEPSRNCFLAHHQNL